MSLLQRLQQAGPKRILALDGGGIRGALTLGFLQKIEDDLRLQHGGNEDFRLCQYFDLIGGTSTGAIIAGCLSLGMKVEEIREMYFELGGKVFGKKHNWWNIFQLNEFLHAQYDAGPLENELRNVFGDRTLESADIQTGLCIVAKRADTNSVWPIINHPEGKFYNSEQGKNKEIPLWKAILASCAAPTYFLPQQVAVGGGLPLGAFVDGGLSMATNPALQLLMVATLKGFPFRWKLGADNLLLVSIGTGMEKLAKLPEQISDYNLVNWAKGIPGMLLLDGNWNNQIVLQWLSNSPTAWHIDGEIGALEDDLLVIDTADRKGLISYLRYDQWLAVDSLSPLMNRDYTEQKVENLIEMSHADNRFELYEIGEAAAREMVKQEHFPQRFAMENQAVG